MPRISRFIRQRSKKEGLAPGTLIHVGQVTTDEPQVTLLAYGPEGLEEHALDPETLDTAHLTPERVNWVNVDGLHRTHLLERIGERFSLHPLVLEDLASTGQRPKLEEYEGYWFFVLRMLDYEEASGQISDEQVGLILGTDWLLTFQERPGDVFASVRERIRTGKGRIRKMGVDYLAYCLVDAVVDHYFSILELMGDRLEHISDQLMGDPDQGVLAELHEIRQDLMVLRRAAWPLRNVIHRMQQGQGSMVGDKIGVFIRDAYDHTVQIIDTAETLREMTTDLRDIYLSSLSNRMNETMKVLTVIATVFIPLTFIAGVYGMNFAVMPELGWRYGYPTVLGVMAAVAAGMIVYFSRKRLI